MFEPASPPVASLADARLLRRLRRGEPRALSGLWEQFGGPAWSVCSAITDEPVQARLLLQSVYDLIPARAKGWSLDVPIPCLVAAHVYQSIRAALELPGLDGITPVVPSEPVAPTPEQVIPRLRSLPQNVRLVYVVDLFFGCPAGTSARLSGVPEPQLRVARAAAAWALLDGGSA